MGYTNYYTFKPIPKGQIKLTEKLYQQAIDACNLVARSYRDQHRGTDLSLSGFSAHVKSNAYGGVNFNGKGDLSCENFILREKYNLNFDKPFLGQDGNGFNFCKTRGYPYDVVVKACLLILKFYLKDQIDISWDGPMDDAADGLELARDVTKLNIELPFNGELTLVG